MVQRRQQIQSLLRIHHSLSCSRHWLAYVFLYFELVFDSQAEESLVEEELLGRLGCDIAGSKNCVFRALHCLGPRVQTHCDNPSRSLTLSQEGEPCAVSTVVICPRTELF